MATLDEVIAQISEEDYLHDPIQFIIDSDLRIVSIPGRGVVAGVVGDKNINRINFQMNRYYNGFDMSKFTTRINYINSKKILNYYSVTDMTIEDDLIYFTWLVESDAQCYRMLEKIYAAFIIYIELCFYVNEALYGKIALLDMS